MQENIYKASSELALTDQGGTIITLDTVEIVEDFSCILPFKKGAIDAKAKSCGLCIFKVTSFSSEYKV